jgi:hypothetical protein
VTSNEPEVVLDRSEKYGSGATELLNGPIRYLFC